jgi:galactonate dehydratase
MDDDRASKGNGMKITDFSTFVLQTPWRNLTYLVLETDEGIRGYGEARVVSKTHTVCEYLKDVRRHIIGYDAIDIEDLYKRFTLLDFGLPGEVAMTGLALVEMACWDCIGKKANLPVYALVGGKVRDKIPAYANGWYTVDRTPESFAAAARKVLKRGYRAMKLDPFGNGNLELTREEYFRSQEILEAVFAVAGRDNQVFVEMHGRFAPHQAVEIAKAIEKYSPGWIEEPCRPDDPGALDAVARHTSIPIATGERYYTASQFRDLFPRRTIQILQPDMTQCGGFLETKKICSTAETYSMMIAPHNVGGIISTTAALHLMAGLRNGKILEHFNDFSDNEIKKAGSPYPEVKDGFFDLPQGPGWGVELDMDYLRGHAATQKDHVISDPGLDMFRKADWFKRSHRKPD